MRIDHVTPLTRGLACLALLALLALLASLAGMGAQAGLLPAQAGMAQPLPAAQVATPPRLQPLSADASLVKRPLFAVDRRPHPFVLEGVAGDLGTDGFDYVLTSVLITPDLRMAIVTPAGGGDPVRMRTGQPADGIPGWRLVELSARSAVFEGPKGRKTLELRSYDGTGSARATPPVPSRREPRDASSTADAGAVMDADAGGGASATAAEPLESNP